MDEQATEPTLETPRKKPKITKQAVVTMLERMHTEMKAEWGKLYPQMFKEQLHVRAQRPERAYWHYGNLVGFGEMARIIADRFSDDD